MKKYLVLSMLLCISFAITSCGGNTEATETGTKTEVGQEQDVGNLAETKTEKDTSSGELGDFTFSINNYSLANDYEGNPAIIVDFDFTNNSEEAANFITVAIPKLFQDGVQLENAIIMDNDTYNSNNEMKDIKPGVTLNVQQSWVLSNTTSPVEVELEEFISLDNKKLTKTFNIAQ